jgi:ketosteroid isomerase-like protein
MRDLIRRLAAATFRRLGGSATAAADLDAEGRSLMQLSRDWSDRMASGDLDAIMAGWAEDAVMMPPGLPPLHGTAAIRAYVEDAMRLPGFSIRWEPMSVHVASGGDLAYMVERNVVTMDDAMGRPVTTHGKGVTVWRKDQTGTWKNVVDMWNDAPSPGDAVP